ncbi:MAG: hypothetical protein O3B03_05420 [Proteobacteria bacterium]|nr:hypothetical protein [Pseudomonadota bacterium]
MTTALAIAKSKNAQKHEESDQDYQDRMVKDVYLALEGKKKRTKKEEDEFSSLHKKILAFQIVNEGAISRTMADVDLQEAASRMYTDLSSEFGEMTPAKHLLLDRLVCAWNMATSYERLFKMIKYKVTEQEDSSLYMSYKHDKSSIKLMQETRKGMQTANDQIVRLTQALRDYSSPPLQVNVKNAFIAQNQQINQRSPKDLDNVQEPKK